jgi:hypothetical protein
VTSSLFSFEKIRFVAVETTMSLMIRRCFLLALGLLMKQCLAFTVASKPRVGNVATHRLETAVMSSFYGDFENFDDEDEDEDEDDDYDDLDDADLDDFRSKMGSLFEDKELGSVDELISFATNKTTDEITEWANPIAKLEAGCVLVANPANFCTDFGSSKKSPSSALLSKFGLTLPPPADLGPDRRADLLPVLVLLERHPLRGSQAVLLNRRTGYLLGDLEQQDTGTVPAPKLGAFMIQPLWFGGTSAGSADESSGLDMLHLCPAVEGAKKLTNDGLYWGGDPAQAQDAMRDPSLDRVMTGFDFKFFVQSTRWLPLQVISECFLFIVISS